MEKGKLWSSGRKERKKKLTDFVINNHACYSCSAV